MVQHMRHVMLAAAAVCDTIAMWMLGVTTVCSMLLLGSL
jgi:hypothetical protein